MWVFTKYGFFSAVCARQGHGEYGQPVDTDRIMVRARVRTHLEGLRERFPELLEDCEILESAHTDYACRIFIAKSIWSEVLAALADETDYDNFKSAVGGNLGTGGAAYGHALHDVWTVMYRFQECH